MWCGVVWCFRRSPLKRRSRSSLRTAGARGEGSEEGERGAAHRKPGEGKEDGRGEGGKGEPNPPAPRLATAKACTARGSKARISWTDRGTCAKAEQGRMPGVSLRRCGEPQLGIQALSARGRAAIPRKKENAATMPLVAASGGGQGGAYTAYATGPSRPHPVCRLCTVPAETCAKCACAKGPVQYQPTQPRLTCAFASSKASSKAAATSGDSNCIRTVFGEGDPKRFSV